MTKGDLVENKRSGEVGIVLDSAIDEMRDHSLIKIFIEGQSTVWVRASWYKVVRSSNRKIPTDH